MIDELFPAAVSCAEEFSDPPGAMLFPAEVAIVARAVDKRRHEFTTGRNCAREALARLGIAPMPILSGERGAPKWPPSIVGSITHCHGYRAAAVARASDIAAVGVDAEPARPLPDGILDSISLASERVRLHALAAQASEVNWDRLLFSAKEAVYKAWFPLARRWLGFEEVDIVFGRDGTFDAHLLVPSVTIEGAALTWFSGRWLIRDGLILTAITVPATAGSRSRG